MFRYLAVLIALICLSDMASAQCCSQSRFGGRLLRVEHTVVRERVGLFPRLRAAVAAPVLAAAAPARVLRTVPQATGGCGPAGCPVIPKK